MSMFGILDTAGSALRTNRVWMDAVSDNLANINTIRPFNQPAFQSRSIIATAVRGDDNDPAGVGDAAGFGDGVHQVADERVDSIDLVGPRAGHFADARALRELSFLADDA